MLAETEYAAGMSARDVQSSLDHLTRAAIVYPYAYQFRIAQARQLFALAHRVPGLIGPAEQSLTYAVRADPGSLEMNSALYIARKAMGDCARAAVIATRLREIAPGSDKVKALIGQECPT